ncbi:MAG: hypothetical protein R3267_01470 [Paenisporosarcina sp.]|jgi:hypothetical protein|nr:hypothetical protein [Paenisporosarcina sp.]
MIIVSLIMFSGIIFYQLLKPSIEERVVPLDVSKKKKMKFRFNGVNSNA